MSDHALLSPSKRDRWSRCPGSIREESRYPESRGGPAAVDGTHTHTLLEKCVTSGADPLGMIGVTLEDHEGTFTVDSERAQRVKVATDYISKRVAEIGDCVVHGEQRVTLHHLTGREDLHGTFDVRLIGGGICEIIDYKDGMHPVSADCPQLEQYAIGTLSGYGMPINGNYPFAEVRQTIIQPKLAYKGLPAITHYDTTVHHLLQGGRLGALVAQAQATDDPQAPLVAGEAQCRYCPHKGACPAYAQLTIGAIGMMFKQEAPVEDFPDFLNPLDLVQQSVSTDPTVMSPDRIRQILEAAPLLRQLLETVEAEALRRMKAGEALPGLKVVNGRSSRKWALSDEAIAEKLKGMGMPKDAIWKTTLISPAQVEKVVWKNRKEEVKQLSKRQLEAIDKEYVVKMAGNLTVALESDGRPAVTLNAAPMFDAVKPALDVPDWMK